MWALWVLVVVVVLPTDRANAFVAPLKARSSPPLLVASRHQKVLSLGRRYRFRLTVDMTLDDGGQGSDEDDDGDENGGGSSGFELKNPFDPVKVADQQSDADSLREMIRRRAEGELDMEESELTQAAIREATRRKLSGESEGPSPWDYFGVDQEADPNNRFEVWSKVDFTDIFHNIDAIMTEEERASMKRIDPLWGRPWWEQIYFHARQTEWGDPKEALKTVPLVILIGGFLWWYSDFTSTWVTHFMEQWGLMPKYADAVKELDWQAMGIPKEMFGPSQQDLERSKQVANVIVKLLDTAADGKLSESAKASILGTNLPQAQQATDAAAGAAAAAASAAGDAVSAIVDNIPDLGN